MAPSSSNATMAEVRHSKFGVGRVQAELGDTVIVRFSHGLEQCAKQDLVEVLSPESALAGGVVSAPGAVILRALAHAMTSCNDTWGVFSPSRIDLLPHQLWVCRKVLERWPFRWLVADDVGLGKTIEAGLVLWPLLARKIVKRLLVLAPASLVEQWQYRMRVMFDIRMAIYHPEADTARQGFWDTHSVVAASLHTLRDDHKDRHERLLSAEPWDLVIVDECHHLNFDEQGGKTLNYQLLEKLVSRERAKSALFFSGTPHRGKHHNFFALLELLRPDLFSHQIPPQEQMKNLHQVMIRNNKQTVTDLQGQPLFHQPVVQSLTYRYTPEETAFYEKLTQFIMTGKAYASSLGQQEGRTVILVLIVMQKLASSSVAAIRSTLKSRSERLKKASENLGRNKPSAKIDESTEENSDEQNQRDEDRLSQMMLKLMEHEQQSIEELLQAAAQVKTETKIAEILRYTRSLPADASVLFFTEYKATQSMLLSALMKEYGEQSASFINGDEFLPAVVLPDGTQSDRRMSRQAAAEHFNSGRIRFLISTEAAGEGIDLQESCHRLIHVDLPWNPMRLHQRHGRLNRYGQSKPVEITLFRNPETVEGQIWDLLMRKIGAINESLAASMDEPEDLFPLVLGMTPQRAIEDLYFDAPRSGGLKSWFDARTSTLGGADIVETVRDLVGNAQKFDFKKVSKLIPNLDLPDLQPFFEAMLRLHRRQIRRTEHGISFKAPEAWASVPGVPGLNENLVFNRRPAGRNESKVTGIGSPVVNQALAEARSSEAFLAFEESVPGDIFLFLVEDQITGSETHIRRIVCGVMREKEGASRFLTDAAIIQMLNPVLEALPASKLFDEGKAVPHPRTSPEDLARLRAVVAEHLPSLQLPFRMPEIHLVGSILKA